MTKVYKEMTEREKKLFEIFQQAVEAERGAQKMYKDAIECTDDEALKKILQGFFDDEARHEKQMVEGYRKLKKDMGLEE